MRRDHERCRLENLERLVDEAGSAAALARRAGTSPSYLSQVRNQLKTVNGRARGIGDELAEKLERAMRKPVGWLDMAHPQIVDEPAPYLASAPATIGAHVPVLSWEQAPDWIDGSEVDAIEHLPCPVPCSARSFILQVRGESMAPRFMKGELVYIDPELARLDGCFVVAAPHDGADYDLRQLVTEGTRQYLKAWNPDWPERVTGVERGTRWLGRVIFRGERF